MKKSYFVSTVKGLLKDVKDGYYGVPEVIDEIWDMIKDEQVTSNSRWKEIQKLRKKLGTSTYPDTSEKKI